MTHHDCTDQQTHRFTARDIIWPALAAAAFTLGLGLSELRLDPVAIQPAPGALTDGVEDWHGNVRRSGHN